jgi:hypothetical protein
MIKYLSLAATLILVSNNTTFAKIWRVNNTPGVNADFVDGQSAVNAASNGDTIYFEPSTTIYPYVQVLYKRLNIFTGSTNGQNFGTSSQSQRFATILSLTLSNATGSFASVRFANQISVSNSDSITLDKCARANPNSPLTQISSAAGYVGVLNCDGLRITRSRLSAISFYSSSTNFTVTNCLLDEAINTSDSSSNGTIAYNTMYINQYAAVLGTGAYLGANTLHNTSVISNIYAHNTFTTFLNCLVDYNVELTSVSNFLIANSILTSTIGTNNLTPGFEQLYGGFTPASYGSFPIFEEDYRWVDYANSNYYGITTSNTNNYQAGVLSPLPFLHGVVVPTINSGGSMQVQFSAISGK